MNSLILGTAEFNKNGYAGKPALLTKDIIKILNLAWEGGIRTLDCADTYNTEEVEKYFGGFHRINKTRDLAKINAAINDYKSKLSYYHYRPGEKRIAGMKVASIYDIEQTEGLYEGIIPLNINDTRFIGKDLSCNYYIRSVFDRGRLLEQGYTVKECLSFVARHYSKGVIVGVNSTKELEEILTAWGSIHANKPL